MSQRPEDPFVVNRWNSARAGGPGFISFRINSFALFLSRAHELALSRESKIVSWKTVQDRVMDPLKLSVSLPGPAGGELELRFTGSGQLEAC